MQLSAPWLEERMVLTAGFAAVLQTFAWVDLQCKNCGNCQVFTASSGQFQESFPSGQNYKRNADCEWIIAPAKASSVTLRFLFINTHNEDAVSVFSCQDVECSAAGRGDLLRAVGCYNGPQWWCASVLPVTSTTGIMLVKFLSNGFDEAEGFEAMWTSTSSGSLLPRLAPRLTSSGSLVLRLLRRPAPDHLAPSLCCLNDFLWENVCKAALQCKPRGISARPDAGPHVSMSNGMDATSSRSSIEC